MKISNIFRSILILSAFGIVTIANAQTDKNRIIDQIQEVSLKSTVLPVDMGTMTADSVKISETVLEYYNTVKDEQTYNYNLLNTEALKTTLLSSYAPNGSNALSALLCLDSGKDIKYHFYNTTGENFTISFDREQLLNALGVNEITQEFRLSLVEKSLKTATGPYEIGYKLVDINKNYLEMGLYVERSMSKAEKRSFSPDLASAFLSKDILSLMPLYALYLEKGYKVTLIEPRNKKNTPYKISYEKLSECFEYINKPRREELYEEPVEQTQETKNNTKQSLDVKPSFNGGRSNKFAIWVNSQLKFPKMMIEYRIRGTVIVKFTIAEDGTLTNIKVVKGVHPDLDEEVVRVVASSPRWSPGIFEGQPVPVTYTIPVIYQLR